MKTSYKLDVTAHIELSCAELNILIAAMGDSQDWHRAHPNNSLVSKDQIMVVDDMHARLIELSADITCAV